MDDKLTHRSHEQELLDRILGYLGEHFDSSRLYEMLHDEMNMSHDDIELLGFDLQDCYRQDMEQDKSADCLREAEEKWNALCEQEQLAEPQMTM